MSEALVPSPASAAVAMMEALLGRASSLTPGLAPFQSDAVTRLNNIMDRYGGALLCDSVGLGKTHVAATIVTAAARSGHTVLVTAPAQLRTQWSRQLRNVHRWRWASHTQLSRLATAERLSRTSFDLIVVDEAHAFRNARTHRYGILARIAHGARLLLITATPVNNSLLDFYHLLHLFAADDAFIAIGIPDLRAELDAALERRPHRLHRVARQVIVRRTREDVRLWQSGAGSEPNEVIRFPARSATQLVDYDLDEVYAGHLHSICEQVGELRLAAYARTKHAFAAELLRLGLMKRLESGIDAFEQSVTRLLRLNELFCSAAEQGLFFDAPRDVALALPVDGALQLALEQLALQRWPSRLDRTQALCHASRDAELLHGIRDALLSARLNGDPKKQLLRQIIWDELPEEKIVVFTEYRATAVALYRALERSGRVACIHGGGARLGGRRTTRRVVIDRFAPMANHARSPRAIEVVRVLVSTDVLAEGVNLQDARVVLSYDLPWNPVRLAQRAGRIDRLGSPHAQIDIRAFRPARDIEIVLRLMRRIRAKIRDIRTVGGDAPAPFRRVTGQPPPRTLTADSVATLREGVRAEFLRFPPTAAHPGRAVGRWEWSPATLCCIQSGGGAVLALAGVDGRIEIDSTLAWQTLRRALHQPDGIALSQEDIDMIAAAEAAALRALSHDRTRRGGTALTRRKPHAVRAVLRRWLAARPGGPSPEDFRLADTVLHLLRHSLPAGAEIGLAAALRQEPETAVRHLAALGARVSNNEPPDPPRVVASVLFRA